MRRPSLFLLCGGLLVSTTAIGLIWGLAVELRVASFDDGAAGTNVRLGANGLLAVALGWAAFARSYRVASLRPVAAFLLFGLVLSVLVGGALAIGAAAEGLLRSDDEFAAVDEYRLDPWVSLDPTISVSLGIPELAALLFVLGLGVVARGAAQGRSRARHLAAASLFALLALEAVQLLLDGAEVAGLVGVLAVAWLAWALRRARQAAHRVPRPPVAATS